MSIDLIEYNGLIITPEDIPTLTEDQKQDLANDLIKRFPNQSDLESVIKSLCLDAYIDWHNPYKKEP